MKNIVISKISRKTEIILFLLTLLLGIFFRLWKLDSLPNGLDGDVNVTARNSLHIFQGSEFKILQNNQIIGHEVAYLFWSVPLGSFLIGFFVNLFKQIEYGALFSSAFIGIISLPLVYLLAKRLTDVSTALLTTFFFVFSPTHLIFSRSGFTHITIIVPLVVSAIFLLYKTVETQNTKLLYICGIIWGLILFNSYPIAFVVAPISVVYLIWMRKWEWFFEIEFISSIIISVLTLLILSIGFAYINGSPDPFIVLKESYYQWVVVRLAETRQETSVAKNIIGGLRMLFLNSPPAYQFGVLRIFNYPLLNPVTGATFLIGLVISIIRRNPTDKLLILWVFFVFSLSSIINVPQERYLFVLLPAPLILSALVIVPVFKTGIKNKYSLLKLLTAISLPVFLAAFAYFTGYRQYFVTYANNNANMTHGLGDGDVAEYLSDNFDPKTTLVISSMSLPGVESIANFQFKQSIIWSEFLKKIEKESVSFSPYETNSPIYPEHPIENIKDKNVATFWYGKTPAIFYLTTKDSQTISSIIAFYSTIEFARSSSSYSIESLGTNQNQWNSLIKEENVGGMSGASVRGINLRTNRLRFTLSKTIVGDALQKVEEVMIFSNPDKQLFIPMGVTDVVLVLALNPNFEYYGNYNNLAKMMYRQADAVFGGIDSKLTKTVLGNNGEVIYKIYSLKTADIQL